MTEKTFAGYVDKFRPWLIGEVNEGNDEWRAWCPIHQDPETGSTPSGSFNFTRSQFHCFGGCGGLPIRTLWKHLQSGTLQSLHPDPSSPQPNGQANVRDIKSAPSSAKRPSARLPTEEELKEYTRQLLGSKLVLDDFREKRGLTKTTIEKFQLGYHNRRYTIPIRNADGELVNVRRYDLHSKEASKKMLPWATGWGSAALYLMDALEQDTVVICEGEMDAIILRQYGFNAMTHTSGAATWLPAWSHHFEDKTVYVVYDVDQAGQQGAIKVAKSVVKVAKSVYIINLPLTVPGSDVTNWFVDHGSTASDFENLMDIAREKPFTSGSARRRSGLNGTPKAVALERSQSSEFTDDTLEIRATIAGKVQPNYLMPKKVSFSCTQDWNLVKCNACPVNAENGHMEFAVDKNAPVLVELVDKNKEQRNRILLKMENVPPTCPKVVVEEPEQWNVEKLILVPDVSSRQANEIQTPIERTAFNVGPYGTPVNTTVDIVGVNLTSPETGHAILQSWECNQVQTDLDSFVMTPELHDALKVFQPKKKQTPYEKMEHIAEDLAANVTRIFGRGLLHMAYDVVWHSVMAFTLNGKFEEKGWLELLVVGDTRTGKSEAALRLCDHYRAGVLKSCEGATLAGLVGGARQTSGNHWMVTWGTIPLNDRRLVVLDEFSGIADKNVIEQMSSVRSSGRAQITKIVSQETSARTRLIWISNPSDGRSINEHSKGAIQAVENMIKTPEDISRFDLAMCASSEDVESIRINTQDQPVVKHKYTEELCSALVSWAWSRRPEQVVWHEDTEKYLLQRAEAIGKRYIPEPPLVQPASIRVKLARLAIAIAARTYSTEDGELVLVRKVHVQSAEQLIESLYDMPSFGYREYSRKMLRDRARAKANRDEIVQYLTLHKEDTYVVLQSVMGGDFRGRDFEEFGAMSRDEAQTAMRKLQELKMVRRYAKGYVRMDPALVDILKELEDEWDA